MTNVHMTLPLDATSFNTGISLGQMYATSDTPMQNSSTDAKSTEEELVFAVVNASGFIDISEYSGRVFLQKDWFKAMKKDLTNTVAISASVGSSTSITSFTLSLTKSNPQPKKADNRNGASIGSMRFPADCSRILNDLCFWSSATYRIYENENGTILGSLSPSYFQEVCTNYTVKYTIKDTSNFALLRPTIEEPAWFLLVHAPLNRDAAHTEHYQFNHKRRARISGDILDLPVTCWVETGKSGSGKGGKRYNTTKRLEIHVLDRNDNAPMAQYTDIKIYLEDNRVKEGYELHHDKLLFIDRDSLEVNTYDIRILNDTEELLEPRCTPYAVDHHVSNLTALHCKLVFRRSTQMPTSPYTIIIQINDTSLLNGLNASHVQLPIQIISDGSKDQVNISSVPLAIYPKQFIEIYRSAAPFARLTQPKTISVNVGHFRIMASNSNKNDGSADASDTNHNGCFDVTPDTGIVFVHNVALLRIASNMRLNIQWINGSNMQDHDELTVHVINEPTPTCTNITAGLELNISDMVDNWNFCSNFQSFRECESQTCGLSTGGYASIENIKKRNGPPRCQWRGEKSPGEESTPHYATCTPDVLTCPDGVCDELEDLHHLICPQDCTTSRVISTIPNDNKRGIKIAAGICKCDYIDNCYCNIKDKRKKSVITGKSDSRTIGNLSASSPNGSVLLYNSLNRHTDHRPTTICGTSCIIGLTAATIFILLSLTGAVLYWKLGLGMTKVRRRRRSSKYSDDIPDLLSAQLSDYVERNNGASPTTLGNAEQLLMLGQHTGMGVTLDMGNGVIGIMIGSRLIPPPDPKWEFPRSQLIIEQTLGEGEFGRVLRAKAKDITGHPGCTTVAVKTLKDDARDAELADLMSEYELLKGVCHPNVIKLLGASTVPGGPIYLIMEFAEYGSLRSYIRRTRHLKSESDIPVSDRLNPQILEHYDEPKTQPQQEDLSSKDILSFAWQISKGMVYLTDIKLVHRDLAARNVLVASGKICKISDFGLTRDIYEDDAYFKRSKGRVPVKWMAPESLSDHIYTTKSDIWSFGVLIWELVTLGATPYPGIPVQNLFHVLKNGYRMERPENCSPAIYRIMRQCWESDPDRRPTFIDLALQWETMLEQDIEYLDLTPDAIHNRSYFCTLLSDDNNESDCTTILNPAFSPITQSRSQTDFSKILNNEEQLNLEKNQQSSIKHGESSKFLTTASTIEDKSNNNNNNIINKSNPYSNTPNLNSQQPATTKTTGNAQQQNNITAEESDALIADNRIVEGYETPVNVNQKSPGNRTPTNEHPQYYTDMTVGSNGSAGSKQLLLPRGNGNIITDLIDTN